MPAFRFTALAEKFGFITIAKEVAVSNPAARVAEIMAEGKKAGIAWEIERQTTLMGKVTLPQYDPAAGIAEILATSFAGYSQFLVTPQGDYVIKQSGPEPARFQREVRTCKALRSAIRAADPSFNFSPL